MDSGILIDRTYVTAMHLYTIGHSNRTAEDYLALLKQHGIERLVDVRRVPRSRFNPHFNEKSLATLLAEHRIAYEPIPELGGMRKAQPNSINTAMRKDGGFQGFADYMQTLEFEMALERLLDNDKRTAFMCAEREPSQCHRGLIADALVARGHRVTHIVRTEEIYDHALRKQAVVVNGVPIYPAATRQLALL